MSARAYACAQRLLHTGIDWTCSSGGVCCCGPTRPYFRTCSRAVPAHDIDPFPGDACLQVRDREPNSTRFFLVTDDVSARARVREALAPHNVEHLDAPLVHSGLGQQAREGQRAVFLDWWVLGETQDAVLSDSSSFGYTAAARALHWGRAGEGASQGQREGGMAGPVLGAPVVPVTVWNSDAPARTCGRRVWEYCKRNCRTPFVNAAELGFTRYPDLPVSSGEPQPDRAQVNPQP